jgi:helicase required for RNAi-mediated heterochromatin assembly 1
MLKTTPNGSSSLRLQPSGTHHFLLDTTCPVPSNPSPASRTRVNSESSHGQWEAYTNGGVIADDARYLQKAKEEQAEDLEPFRKTPPNAGGSAKAKKLVEVSLEKKTASKNAGLLIDLDIGTEVSYPQSYANAASSWKGKGTAKPGQNFLD